MILNMAKHLQSYLTMNYARLAIGWPICKEIVNVKTSTYSKRSITRHKPTKL